MPHERKDVIRETAGGMMEFVIIVGKLRVKKLFLPDLFIHGAGSENRTRTRLPPPDFESGASTSSAIPA
jgi:hypothetical protein